MRGGYPAVYDRLTDVQDRLDRALLGREEPPSHARAKQQLKQAGVSAKQIIRADSDAILFLTQAGQVATAWSRTDANDKTTFLIETGMPADPPDEWGHGE